MRYSFRHGDSLSTLDLLHLLHPLLPLPLLQLRYVSNRKNALRSEGQKLAMVETRTKTQKSSSVVKSAQRVEALRHREHGNVQLTFEKRLIILRLVVGIGNSGTSLKKPSTTMTELSLVVTQAKHIMERLVIGASWMFHQGRDA